MKFRKIFFLLKKIFHALKQIVLGKRNSLPCEIVKSNTREAFEFFFSQDSFIKKYYLQKERLAFCEFVGDYCVQLFDKLEGKNDILRIVDLGCGTGHILKTIDRKLSKTKGFCRRFELFGLDFARSAIDRAKKLLPKATFLVEDIYKNSFPSNYFDLVLCIETLEHLHKPEEAILELLRICNYDGKIIITVPNGEVDHWDGHINFWTLPQLQQFLSPYGLIDIRLIPGHPNIIATLTKEKLWKA
jgi:SAM-dependent methyltransferase